MVSGSFQMKVWTLMIQRNDPRYSMILVIRWTLIIQSLWWYLHLLHQTCLWKPFYEQSPDPLFLPCRHQCLDWCTPKSQVRYLHASTCAKFKTCCSFHWTLIGNSESIHLFQKCLINPPATGLIVFLQTLQDIVVEGVGLKTNRAYCCQIPGKR